MRLLSLVNLMLDIWHVTVDALVKFGLVSVSIYISVLHTTFKVRPNPIAQ